MNKETIDRLNKVREQHDTDYIPGIITACIALSILGLFGLILLIATTC